MSTTPFWKKIHQTVCGYSENITDDIVSDILDLSKNELTNGLLSYKPYSKKAYDDWVESSNIGTGKKEFVHDLSEDFNLDAKIAYPVMCNYLMFEYYGKIKEFWQMTRVGTTVRLKESIWNFYTSERMFLLKTIRHIFENVSNENYKFTPQYKQFLSSIKVPTLQKNLFKQLENLLEEANYKKINEENIYFRNWLCRIYREQIEVLMIIVLTGCHSKFTNDQILQLIRLIILAHLKSQSIYVQFARFSSRIDIEQLQAMELAAFLIILQDLWDKDLTNFWEDSATKEIDFAILDLKDSSINTIVMLVWLIFKSKTISIGEHEDKIVELLKTKPFQKFYALVTNEIFKDCRVGEFALKATHRVVDEICLIFGDRKVLFEEEGLIRLATEFLKQPELTEICLKTRGGLDSVLEIAIEAFPYDFYSFTSIAHALLGQENQYKNTIHLLNNLPSFLSDMTWSSAQDEIYVLKTEQPAFTNGDLIIFPAKTTVKSYAIFGKNLVQLRGTYSYFKLLEHFLNDLIEGAMSEHKYDEALMKKVITGFDVVMQGIRYCVDMDLSVIGLQRIIQKLDKILLYLDGPLLEPELVKLYFSVQNCLMVHRKSDFFNTCPDIVWQVFVPKIKVEHSGIDVRNYLFNQYIFDESILIKLFKEEEFKDDHTIILNYIEILQNAIKINLYHKNVQLSGLAYIFNFVFLQHQSWNFSDKRQKIKITIGCLNIFHYILQKSRRELNEFEQRVFDLCHYAFLNNPYIIESFLRLFVIEKYHLIFLMERESNWQKGPSLEKFTCIQMQIALLLIVMNHKRSVEKCVFEEKLPFVVKPVASYFTNSYSSVIAELACRFLEKMAHNAQIPLLALLELDHYQVQSLFLERLRDPVEDDKVKLAIIDLINTCIKTQNGMTAAFFNLKCFMYWDGAENDPIGGDTVCNFMVDYLQNIKRSHEFFKNPLQLGILRLLNNLWLNQRENLIEDISKLKDFWPVMIEPIFCDFIQDVEVYTVILRIINLEINLNVEKVEKNLIETVTRFLTDKKQLKKWIQFLLRTTMKSDSDSLELLNAWTEFLILAKNAMPECFTTEARFDITITCLNGIVNTPITDGNNTEITFQWAQLYLILISSWTIHEKHENQILEKITLFLHIILAHYKYFTPRIKEIVLSIINKTLIDFKKFFAGSTTLLLAFLNPVGGIVDYEYVLMETTVWYIKEKEEMIAKLKPWLIIIFIGDALLELENVTELNVWFQYRQFLRNVMDSAGSMLQHRATLPFAKIAIHHLITYAESPLAEEFQRVDLFNFLYKIRPPPLTINVNEVLINGLSVVLKEWWLVFISLIRLNRVLIDNLDMRVLNTCFAFLSQHEESFQEIISLTKHTVDMTALTLVCETLKFIYSLMCTKSHWFVEANSYDPIMNDVKSTVNACVLSVLGSRKITFYEIVKGKRLDVVTPPPTELLASVLNKLIEIIYWASSCLNKSKPNLNKLLDVSELDENLPILVDNDFSVPRFELPITSNLTYGMLLCLAHYLCKALNQLSPEAQPAKRAEKEYASLVEIKEAIHPKTLGEIFEHCTASSEKYIGFMVYLQKSDDMPSEKLTSFLHYEMTEFSGSSSSAILQLNYQTVKNALEVLMCFLAGEILFMIRILDEDSLFSYKRELCSEIQFFYEFVRKKTSEQYHSTAAKSFSLPQTETDIIKRYMVAKNSNINDVADNNFVLVISQWLVKFCELSN